MITLKQFLASEAVPALGCTEPGAVALAVARALEEVPGEVQSVVITVSKSIYKNGASVGVPGADGLKGNAVAAALAVYYGKSAYGLEVLKDVDKDGKAKAEALLASGKIRIDADMNRQGVYVHAVVRTDKGKGECVIEGKHDSIIKVVKNGETVLDVVTGPAGPSGPSISDRIAKMSFAEALAIADTMTDEDVESLMRGVDMNLSAARYGLEHNVGLGMGKIIANEVRSKDDIAQLIKAWTAGAADARMSGAMIPVMSSAGSGNHGLTAVIPVAIYAQYLNKSRKETAYAVAVSHIVTSFIKSRTGRLTPICGCTVSAGAGAAAALAWLKTGDMAKAAEAVSLILGNLSGMVCDGAKESCALKVGSGAIEAYYSAILAAERTSVDKQGLIGSTVEQSAENLAKMSNEGFGDLDNVLCGIIEDAR